MVKHLEDWFSTHLVLFPLNTPPCVMVTTKNKLISLLHQYTDFIIGT